MFRQYIYFHSHFSQKVKGVVVGGNQTHIFFLKKKPENGKILKSKTKRKQYLPPPPHSWIQVCPWESCALLAAEL